MKTHPLEREFWLGEIKRGFMKEVMELDIDGALSFFFFLAAGGEVD